MTNGAPVEQPTPAGAGGILACVGLVAAALAVLPAAPAARPTAQSAPDPLSSAAFWRLVSDLSEPAGTFRSDNLVSNERAFQHVVPALLDRAPGGAYIGVGPDQNFTYIAALRPRIAFVVDVRRDNLRLHLLYKALIELSANREELVSRLFARRPTARAGAGAAPETLFAAFEAAAADEALARETGDAILRRLTRHHGLPLGDEDARAILDLHAAFVRFGPALTYASSSTDDDRGLPTFAELQLGSDLEGRQHGYLASDEAYEALRRWQHANLIVPVVGDFAGPAALAGIAAYLENRGLAVDAFYASNVEEYLFGDGRWPAFYRNLEHLPRAADGILIRSAPGSSRVDGILPLLRAVNDGRIRTYADITGRGGIR